MASLATPEELSLFLGGQQVDPERAELLLDIASDAVRRACAQTFDLVTDDVATLRGTWAGVLRLPERPVVSVAEVLLDGVEVTDYDLVGDELHRTPGLGWGGSAVTIQVTYTHGFAEVPADLRGWVLTVAARGITNPTGVTQESIDGYAVSYQPGSVKLHRHERLQLRRGYGPRP